MNRSVLIGVTVVDPQAYRVGAYDPDDALTQAIALEDGAGPSFAAGKFVPRPDRRRPPLRVAASSR